MVEVTAADRAAATMRRGGTEPLRPPTADTSPFRGGLLVCVASKGRGMLAGRGGFVSRRDHNLLTRNRAHLAWGRKLEEKNKPIPSYSSGGSAREGLLSEKPPPSQLTVSPTQGRGGSVSRRDHNQANRRHAHSQAEPSQQKHPTRTPTALRERGSGGEALL